METDLQNLFLKYNIENNVIEIENILTDFFSKNKVFKYDDILYIFITLLQYNINVFKKYVLYCIENNVILNNYRYNNINIWVPTKFEKFLKINSNTIIQITDDENKLEIKNFLINII
jgi:hypothetical protein